MPTNMNLNSEFHSVAEYYVSALAGLIQIRSVGLNSSTVVAGQSVELSAFTEELEETGSSASVFLEQAESGGVVNISAGGTNPSIALNSSSMEGGIYSGMGIGADGILLAYGIPGLGGAIAMGEGSMVLTFGEPSAGSSITMTPESITFKVGETQMTMTAEGIVTTAPSVEVNCDDTNVVISPEGITEEVGEVTREMTAEGHNLTAAEVEMNVGVEGVTAEGPISTSEFEGSTELNTAMFTQVMDGMLSVDAPITMVE
jgi:hypothetical protein